MFCQPRNFAAQQSSPEKQWFNGSPAGLQSCVEYVKTFDRMQQRWFYLWIFYFAHKGNVPSSGMGERSSGSCLAVGPPTIFSSVAAQPGVHCPSSILSQILKWALIALLTSQSTPCKTWASGSEGNAALQALPKHLCLQSWGLKPQSTPAGSEWGHHNVKAGITYLLYCIFSAVPVRSETNRKQRQKRNQFHLRVVR